MIPADGQGGSADPEDLRFPEWLRRGKTHTE